MDWLLHFHGFIAPSLALSWGFVVAVNLAGTWKALRWIRPAGANEASSAAGGSTAGLRPVSILKPLKGRDPGIRRNLESFFQLSYPTYELLFSVADSRDPVVPVVESLIARYPRVRARLIVGAVEDVPNPKVGNLLRSYGLARHDWILISDSNTRVDPGYLARLGRQFARDGVDMQTSVIAGAHASGLGGRLEATALNTYFARSMLVAESVGHPCVVGKAMLFRRSALESSGGFASLSGFIAEDYQAGVLLHEHGYKVVVSHDPVAQHIGRPTLRSFWSRQLRWGRIRKAQALSVFFLELLFGAVLSGILGAVAFHSLWGVSIPAFLACHLLLSLGLDALLMERMGQRIDLGTVAAWALRELMHLPLWLHAALGNTVNWRGQVLRLQRHGILEANQPRLSTPAVAYAGAGVFHLHA